MAEDTHNMGKLAENRGGEKLADGSDALDVAELKQGAFRHDHTSEPIEDSLEEVKAQEPKQGGQKSSKK
jgi:hypothetical protein